MKLYKVICVMPPIEDNVILESQPSYVITTGMHRAEEIVKAARPNVLIVKIELVGDVLIDGAL